MGTYDPPQSFQKFPIKYCNEEIWNGHLKNKHKQVGLNVSDTKSSILVSSLKESKRKKTTHNNRNGIHIAKRTISILTNVLDFLSNLYDQGYHIVL